MHPSEQLERQMDRVAEDYEQGRISREEYDAEMKYLQREYRETAQEAAADAYRDEMERW